MLPSLPSLAPRDSHSLWYTSTHNPSVLPIYDTNISHNGAQNQNNQSRRVANHSYRTPLTRLRADEIYMARRKAHIQNYGNNWMRPPGVPKTAFQMAEELREYKEQQEAERRDRLAQEELAAAEAEGQDELLQEGEDGEMEGARDLDDDIPEADTTGLTNQESEESGEDDEDEDEADDETEDLSQEGDHSVTQGQDAAYRMQILLSMNSRNQGLGESGSTTEDEDPSQMLQEEDLVHVGDDDMSQDVDMGMGMDMDGDLDEDVPEASGEYEHTDTEEEISSSEPEDEDEDDDGEDEDAGEDDDNNDGEESVDLGRVPQGRGFASSMVRSDGTQNSMALGSGGSAIGSSPQQRAPPRSARRGRTD